MIYGVVPPLFGGEPLNAVTGRLDALKALGIDALWLSPINQTDDPSAISYAVTGFRAIRPDFGTEADLRRLVDGAHARGMRVLMDFVPNHTSTGHPFYQLAARQGPDSRFWDWYVRDQKGQAVHYFDWTNLKNLNFFHPPVARAMTDAFTFWPRVFGVDGFRVDAAWGPRQRTPSFWPELAAAVRAERPDAFLLAEASARDPYYVRHGFDAAYDWTAKLGEWAWGDAWAAPAQAGRKLARALSFRETPPDRVARFINNNDTGQRFVTRHGVPLQRVAATLMLTVPGVPMVYTGDEVGAEFEPYADPPPISWEDRHGLRPLYERLIRLRGELPALRRGSFKVYDLPRTPGVLAYERAAGADVVVAVLNFGGPARVKLPWPAALRQGAVDRLTGRRVARTAVMALPATSAMLLGPSPAR